MSNVIRSFIHHYGTCQDCGKSFGAANVLGLAAQHADKYGHHVYVETGHAYMVAPNGQRPAFGYGTGG